MNTEEPEVEPRLISCGPNMETATIRFGEQEYCYDIKGSTGLQSLSVIAAPIEPERYIDREAIAQLSAELEAREPGTYNAERLLGDVRRKLRRISEGKNLES